MQENIKEVLYQISQYPAFSVRLQNQQKLGANKEAKVARRKKSEQRRKDPLQKQDAPAAGWGLGRNMPPEEETGPESFAGVMQSAFSHLLCWQTVEDQVSWADLQMEMMVTKIQRS